MGIGLPDEITLASIPGSNGLYSAGDDEKVYCHSSARTNSKRPTPFQLAETTSIDTGYKNVSVVINGRRKTKSVHVLVCSAFHGPKPFPKAEVRHLDGTRINNRPSNICWGTRAENEADKRRHGTQAIGAKQGCAKLNDEAVRILRIAIPPGLWNPVDAAKVFGVWPSTIRAIVSGKNWRHVLEHEEEGISFRRIEETAGTGLTIPTIKEERHVSVLR